MTSMESLYPVHRIQEAQTTIYQVLWELTAKEVSHVPRHTR
jgi:hypothetical protein